MTFEEARAYTEQPLGVSAPLKLPNADGIACPGLVDYNVRIIKKFPTLIILEKVKDASQNI